MFQYIKYSSIFLILIFSQTLISAYSNNPDRMKVNAPTAGFSIDQADATYCAGDTVKFISQSTSYSALHWEYGDGKETWNFTETDHIFFGAGVYTVTLTAIDATGLTDVFTKDITILPAPVLEIIANGDTTFYQGGSVELTAQGDTYATVDWSSGEISETIVVALAGIYTVSVTNEYGCSITDQITIQVLKESSAYEIRPANNILTPNGDAVNDLLFFEDLEEILNVVDIQIFNQWGNLVYTNREYGNNWSGKDSNGNDLVAGTYYYIVRSEGRNVQTGYVDIIR